jgi:hypothetical protein
MSVFNSFIYSEDSTTITGFDGEPGNNCSVQFIDKPNGNIPVTNVNIATDLTSSTSGLKFDFTRLASLQTITNVCGDNLTNLQAAIVSVDISLSAGLAIKNYAFNGCTELQTVDMSGSSYLAINGYAFNGCIGLESVNMSYSIGLTITGSAFNGCTGLQSVDMSYSIGLKITGLAFNGCTGLQSVDMSYSTGLTLAAYAFDNRIGLESVDMSYSKNLTITGLAFNGCTGLQTVDMSDSKILTINTYAFQNTGPRTLDMSGSTNLKTFVNSFNNCANIQSVDMSRSNNLFIDVLAFNSCTELKTIDMSYSKNLTITGMAFNNCTGLQSVDMSYSTDLLIYGQFSGCTELKTIDMSYSTGLSITSVNAFYFCTSLKTVNMTSSKNLRFNGHTTFNGCVNLTEITFPVGLTILDAKALLWTDLINNYLPPPEYVKYYLNSTQEDALNISITNLDSIENLPNNLTYSSGVLSGSIINSGTFPVTFNVDTGIGVEGGGGGGGGGGLEGDGGVGDLEGGGGGGIGVGDLESGGGGVDGDIGGISITINFVNVNTLVCFLPGSQILINQDPVTYKAIEDLVETDSVISCFTHTPVSIKKCVRHAVRLQELEPTNVPYVIPKDFFGSNTPNQDVYLSGHHRIIFNLNDNSKLGVQTFKIDGLKPAVIANEELYYYHIELNSEDTDGVICSNIPVEALEHG